MNVYKLNEASSYSKRKFNLVIVYLVYVYGVYKYTQRHTHLFLAMNYLEVVLASKLGIFLLVFWVLCVCVCARAMELFLHSHTHTHTDTYTGWVEHLDSQNL